MDLPVITQQPLATQIGDRLAARQASWIKNVVIAAGLIVVVATLLWQGITAHGNPDPTVDGISHPAVILDTGILVFREGLEAILVLAALTASLVRTEENFWRPVAIGAGVSFLASIATYFIVVAVISEINAPALDVQAATGLLAVVVLLVIMNWFFHKVYWTGWITLHNRRKQALVKGGTSNKNLIFRGLLLIGFTSVYREGFEIVLFLQTLRLKAGSHVIFEGTLIGLSLTAIVAYLTFVAHYKLPYKRMLVLTGIMLGAVLVVMVGESVQEMQQAGWCPTHTLEKINMPDWMNTWFAVYNSVESLLSQVFAVVFVVGSYYLARRVCRSPRSNTTDAAQCILPDCDHCELAPTTDSH